MAKAERDPTVKYIVVLAHEPFFPNGGHASDALWYGGNNTVRSWRAVNGVMTPFEPGVIDVRNHLWELFSNSKESGGRARVRRARYHRSLITRTTPVGVPAVDDLNHDGKLERRKISPNPKFTYPTWFMVCGGAGAPYYTQEQTPWSGAVKKFTAQNNYFIIHSRRKRIGLEVFNANGQLLDSITNLLDVKRK